MRKLIGWTLLTSSLFSEPVIAEAQQAPGVSASVSYQFMQLTVYEGRRSYLTFTPTFKDQKLAELSEVYLDNLYSEKNRFRLRTVEEATMIWLDEISAAGWELFRVEPLLVNSAEPAVLTRYLFRKPRG